MRKINWLVIHTAATRPGMDVGVKEIRAWHKMRGFDTIGYHYVIRRDGRVEKGRADSHVGAHVSGHNSDSLGICLVGGVNDNLEPENNYTEAQWKSLEILLRGLAQKYPNAYVTGHRDFPGVNKACPCFDAEPWAAARGFRTKRQRNAMVEELKGSKTLAGASLASLGGVGSELKDTASEVSALAAYSDYISFASVALMVIGVGLIVYSRVSDARNNPKFVGRPEPDNIETMAG